MAFFATSTPLKAGQPAPDFVLSSQDGSPVGLRDFLGSWVVLYFYPKDNTRVCTIEARGFEKDLDRYRLAGATVLGISLDSPASHQKFCAKQGLTFKLLADTEKKVAAQYGCLNSLFGFQIAARNTFLIDPQGQIAHVWASVDAGRHSEQVLAALAAARA